MKKIFLVLVSVLAIFAAGCKQAAGDDSVASIRFQNMLHNSGVEQNINYGVRMGDAVHNGSLVYHGVTDYYDTAPGYYSVQLKDASGNWLTVSTGAMNASKEGKYTLVLAGDVGYDTAYFQIIKDE